MVLGEIMLNKIFNKIQKENRSRKFNLFTSTFDNLEKYKILDVGCGEGTFLEEMNPYKNNITAVDISEINIEQFKKNHPSIKISQGDAKNMDFDDKSFDILFSNAVIEHVGDIIEQKKYASEIRRVGKSYFIITPNKWFPFEPHYRFPLFQFIPKKIQKLITKIFSMGNYPRGCWEDINLLSASQLKSLFPEAKIIKLRMTIYPETLIAIYSDKLNREVQSENID